MRKALLVFVVCFGVLFIKQAYADFEAVETTLTQLEKIQKKAQVLQQKYQKIESAINSARQGDFGPLTALKSEFDVEKFIPKQLKGLANAKNPSEMVDAIKTNKVLNQSDKNQSETHNEYKTQYNADLREKLSLLYAYAFTDRSKMSKENKERNDEAKQTDDSREMLQLANKEILESAERMRRIVVMISSRYELDLLITAQGLEDKYKDEEGDAE